MFKKIISIMDITLLKFVLVGITNTIFGTGVMFFSYNILKLNYWISSSLNYILGSILSYYLNKKYTFKSKGDNTDILRFSINIALCYVLAYGIAKPLAGLFFYSYTQKIKDNVAMLIGMGLFVILNYIGQRYFVFKT